jgi:hypothetical protein
MKNQGVFYTNDTIKPTVSFFDFDGAVLEPDTVTLTVTDDSGAVLETYTTGDLTHSSGSGVYSLLYTTPQTAQVLKFNFSGTLSGLPIQTETIKIQTAAP